MKNGIVLTLLAGLLATGCSSPRGGTSDDVDQSYGTGSSQRNDSMSNTNGPNRTPDNPAIPNSDWPNGADTPGNPGNDSSKP